MQLKASVKHLQIDRANNAMFYMVAAAAVITVFSLVSAKSLLSQSSYQHKVLKARNEAIKKLKSNLEAANSLKQHYEVFESQTPNIIGGRGGLDIASAIAKGVNGGSVSVNGQPVALSGQDGDNAKIVLDALPSVYDFPALISSIEKIAVIDNVPLQSVTGSDDSATQTTAESSAVSSQPTTISFALTTKLDYNVAKTLTGDLERSIRPVDITTFALDGSGNSLNVSIQANTYYQAPISLQIRQKEIQ
jgi:hypothetical protein